MNSSAATRGNLLRHSLVIALIAGLGSTIFAPVAASARLPANSATSKGVKAPIKWTVCGSRLRCARVEVPLDWEHPDGRNLQLALIRHLASRPGKRIGSLFLNPGGPGDSGVDAVAARGEALDALTEGRFDIVGWDVRGSARSAPVHCFSSPSERAAFWRGLPVPTSRLAERRYLAKTEALATRCGTQNGDLLAHISTADTVRDLDYLRLLVGDQKLNFLGESTGTLLGQTYANMFPRRVRAIVLDGLIDPVAYTNGTASALSSGLRDVDRLFSKFLALCQAAGSDRCPLAGQGTSVARRVHGVLRSLRRGPIAASTGELTYGEVLAALKFAVLPDPAIWPSAAALIEAAAEGDAAPLDTIASGYSAEMFHRQLEPNTALLCADSPARQHTRAWPGVVDRLEHASRLGAAPMGWAIGAPCASWPRRSAHRYTGPWNATTPNPILLIGTRFDPNTPLANARLAENRLGNASLLIHDGYGHLSTADPSECVEKAKGTYFVHLITPPNRTVCPADRLPFDPSFGQPIP